MNMLPFIDIPVTNSFDLRTKYLFCKYRPINISVATKILINTEVSAMLNPNEYGNECEVLSESESESESEI